MNSIVVLYLLLKGPHWFQLLNLHGILCVQHDVGSQALLPDYYLEIIVDIAQK